MNLFSISSLILCLSGIAFSLIIYHSDRTSKVNKAWFFSCISFSAWALGLYGVTSASEPHVAMAWQYILDVSAIFLPYLFFVFVCELLKIRIPATRTALFFTAAALSLLSFSPVFKVGMTVSYGFFWVSPGELYFLFPTYFILYAIVTIGVLVRTYFRSAPKSVERGQIRNTLIAGTMGYVGGVTNFFPQLFSIYPYGNYLVIFYIVFMVYGVLRYKLLSGKVISAQVFSTALILVSLFNLLKSNGIQDWLLNSLTLLIVIVFSAFLINSVDREVKAREHIEKLAADLKKANIRLTELDRQKSEFVSFATHQLRAPLAAMKGYASLILEGDLGKLPPEAEKAVNRIFDSTNTLTSIVDDYLNIARIELGSMKYAFETIDFKTLVEDVIAELKPNIDKKPEVTLNFMAENSGTDYRTTADRDKLKQVVTNLIDNSIKYTPTGRVDVTLGLDKVKHKFILKIKDTGIGIAPETLPHLFNKFSRAENANKTNIKGTGLGLFVAKEMITAHHGTIRAESPGEGKGSTFIVELEPFAKA